jgi:ParB family chromosome partitioning protein
LKQVIRDHLSGSNGRPKVDNWLPRWLRFPAAAYTERGRSAGEPSECITALAAE